MLEPVNGSGFAGAPAVVGADDVEEVLGFVVVVEPSDTKVVDVEPRPVTGVVAVDVVGLAVVGVVGGTVVVGAVVVGATVVVDAAVDEGAAVLVGAAVVVGAAVLVVGPGAQSDKVCCACAEPPPSGEDHESFAFTTCVPVARSSAAESVTSGPVMAKSLSTTVMPSTVTASCAVVGPLEKLE